VNRLAPDNTVMKWPVGLLMLGIVLVAALPLEAAEPQASVRVFDPPEPVEGPSRTGFVPPPGDFSHLKARSPRSLLDLPERFDWRDQGVITEVGDQGNCGCCYAFAAVSNIESAILIDGGPLYDFSVNNVKECDWWAINYGLGSCNGGNGSMVASFLSQKGTVHEACDPFDPRNVICKEGCPYILTLTGWLQISGDEQAPVPTIKDYVYNYGPLFSAIIVTKPSGWRNEFSAYDGSYVLEYDEHDPSDLEDHAVMIVGWDDTLSHAGGQGAWIVKNSWGTDWGEEGFFYIAYGSAHIGTYVSTAYEWQAYDYDGVVFFHDDAGFMGTSLGYGMTTGWALAKYVPDEAVRLERVEFWTTDAATDVDIYIYDGFNGSSLMGKLAEETDIETEAYGYHSVELSSPVEVSATNDFYVVVKITNDSYEFPIALDNYGPTSPGNCYVSTNGTSWTDVTEVSGCTACAVSDVCVRARGSRLTSTSVIRVPGMYSTIEEGLAAADPGDTVLVGPGTYVEGSLTIDEDIVLMSEAGPESTIIDAEGQELMASIPHPTVLSLVGVGNGCQVIGLDIRGAQSDGAGAGISIVNSTPTIAECVITLNESVSGAGIVVENSSPFILNCTVAENIGLAGIYFDAASGGLVNKCIVSGTDGGPGVYCNSAAPTIGCSDVFANVGVITGGTDGGGNFSEDPMYCWRYEAVYTLQQGSPCLEGYGCGQVGALGEGCLSQVPSMLSSFLSMPADESTELTWILPAGPVEGAYIVYKTTGFPQDAYDGTPVENGMYGYFSGEPSEADTFYHTGLTNGQTYYYTAYAYNQDYKSAGGLMDSAVPADGSPPAQVENFSADSGDSSVTLSWTFPADDDLVGVMLRYGTSNYPQLPDDGIAVENDSGGVFHGVPGTDSTFVHTGLDSGVTYLYSAFSFDEAPNYADAVNTSATPGVDDNPPGEVRSFVALPSDTTVTLSWMNPGEQDFLHTILRFSTTTYPNLPTDGQAVDNGNGGIFPKEPAESDTFAHTGLENGTMYYYTAFTVDNLLNVSNGASVYATPQDTTPPGPVTGLTAFGGDAEVVLRWTNPGDADFAGVKIVYSTSSYPAGPGDGTEANPGGTPAPVDSFVHMNRVNGQAYYYSVFARDEADNFSGAANAQATPVDETPPELDISVFRNPYLSNYLDIYVVASEALILDSLFVTVSGADVEMETSDSDDHVYRGDYDLYSTGTITIDARARDLALNPGSAQRQFSSSLILASAGGEVRSVDGGFSLAVPPGAVLRDAYVLVWRREPESEGVVEAYEVNGAPYELADFARVEFGYDETVTDPEGLGVTGGVGDAAVGLDSYIDREARKIIAYARELGVFSLARREGAASPPLGKGVSILYNSPNPFEHATEIAYEVSRASQLTIEILGVDGRVVRALYEGGITAGRHSITWDGRDEGGARVSSGVYFVRIISPSGVASRKVAVLR